MDERDVERFWSRVDRTPGQGPAGDCWIWQGPLARNGYGRFHVWKPKHRNLAAHRVAYACVAVEPAPDGLDVMHSCDHRSCVNPAHLSPGSRSENMKDAAAKRRITTIGKSAQTHCHKGHEYTALMTAIRDAGRVYSFAGLETSGRIDLGGCAAGA